MEDKYAGLTAERSQHDAEEKARLEAERQADKAKEEANTINPLNLIIDAATRYISSGGNPIAAATALINPVKGSEVRLDTIPGSIASGMMSKGLEPIGPPNPDILARGVDTLKNMGSSPEMMMKSAAYLPTLQDRGKSFQGLQTMAEIDAKTRAAKEAATKTGLEAKKIEQEIATGKQLERKYSADADYTNKGKTAGYKPTSFNDAMRVLAYTTKQNTNLAGQISPEGQEQIDMQVNYMKETWPDMFKDEEAVEKEIKNTDEVKEKPGLFQSIRDLVWNPKFDKDKETTATIPEFATMEEAYAELSKLKKAGKPIPNTIKVAGKIIRQ